MYRLFIFLFVAVYIIYITTVIMQCFGLGRITKCEIKLIPAFIPFFYWIKKSDKKRKPKSK